MSLRKPLSFLLAICMMLTMLAPIPVRAEGTDDAPASTAVPTSIQAVVRTAEAEKWPEGVEKPDPITITSANLFQSGGSIYIRFTGLPEGSNWYCEVSNSAAGNTEKHFLNVNENGVAGQNYYYIVSGQSGRVVLTLDVYNEELGYAYQPVTVETYLAAEDEMPVLTAEDFKGRELIYSDRYYGSVNMESDHVSIYFPVSASGFDSYEIYMENADGTILAGTGCGYTAGSKAYARSTTARDVRYDAIFGANGAYYSISCFNVYGSIYPVAELKPGAYDLVVYGSSDGEKTECARAEKAYIVSDQPIVHQITQSGIPSADHPMVELQLSNADPADFSVEIWQSGQRIGMSKPGEYRARLATGGTIYAEYRVPVSKPDKNENNCTAKVVSNVDFVGVREEVYYLHTSSVSATLDSSYYANVLISAAGYDTERVCTATLQKGNASLSTVTFRLNEDKTADVAFTDEDGKPIRLERDEQYMIRFSQGGSSVTVSLSSLDTVSGYSGSAVIGAETNNGLSGRLLSAGETTIQSTSGGLHSVDQGVIRCYLNVDATDAGFAAMTDKDKFQLQLTDRLGRTHLLNATERSEQMSNQNTKRRTTILFALPDASDTPNGYYSAALLYDGNLLVDESGKNALGNYANSYRVSRLMNCGYVVREAEGMYLIDGVRMSNMPEDATVTADLFYTDRFGMTPDYTETLVDGQNSEYLSMPRHDGITPERLRERYTAVFKVNGVPSCNAENHYFLPEALLLDDETTSFALSGEESANGSFELISCPGGETVWDGAEKTGSTDIAAYTEVYVHATPAEGCQLSAVKVNGKPIVGRAFLMTEDSVVTVEFSDVPAEQFDVSVYQWIYNGAVTVSAERVAVGDTLTITANPNKGYRTESVQYREKDSTNWIDVPKSEDGLYRIKMPAYNVEVSATFGSIPRLYIQNQIQFGYSYLYDAVELYTDGVRLDSQSSLTVDPGTKLGVRLNGYTANRLYLASDTQDETYDLTRDGDYWSILLAEDMGATTTSFYLRTDGITENPHAQVSFANEILIDYGDGSYTYPLYGFGEAYLTDANGNQRSSANCGVGETVYYRVAPNAENATYSLSKFEYQYGNQRYSLLTTQHENGLYSFVMPDSGGETVEICLTASPLKRYYCTLYPDAGASVTMNSQSARAGETLTVNLTVYPDYTLNSFTISANDGGQVPYTVTPDGVYQFVMPASDVTISVTTREKGADAPGGEVTDVESLIAALGGSNNIDKTGPQAVGLNKSVTLQAPLRLVDGTLRISLNGRVISAAGEMNTVEVSGGRLQMEYGSVAANGGDALHITGGSVILRGVNVNCPVKENSTGSAVSISGGLLSAGESTVFSGGSTNGAALNVTGTPTIRLQRCEILSTDLGDVVLPALRLPSGVAADTILDEDATFTTAPDLIDGVCRHPLYAVEKGGVMYAINANAYNGAIWLEGEPIAAREGRVIRFTATPADGYELNQVNLSYSTNTDWHSETLTANPDGSFSFTMPAAVVMLDASFVAIKYPAPGGTVNSYDTLLAALGENNAKLGSDADGTFVELVRDIRLAAPLKVTGGKLELRASAFHEAISPVGQSALELSGDAELSLKGRLCFRSEWTDASTAPLALVSGGTLELRGTELASECAGNRDAILLSGGTLIARNVEDASNGTATAIELTSAFGSGSGAALHITGGTAYIEDGFYYGGKVPYSGNTATGGGTAADGGTTAGGGTATGGGATAGGGTATGGGTAAGGGTTAGGGTAAGGTVMSGPAVYITGGALYLSGGQYYPHNPDGSALKVENRPEVKLSGGRFEAVKAWADQTWDGIQTYHVYVPNVILPDGVALKDILADGFTIQLDSAQFDASQTAALSSSEVKAVFSVVSGTAETLRSITVAAPTDATVDIAATAAKAGDQLVFFVKPMAGSRIEKVWLTYREKDGPVEIGLQPMATGGYGFLMPDADVQINVTTVREGFTVTFLNWDGTVLDRQNVAPGGSAVAPTVVPQYPGHTFCGWQGDFANVTSDRTIVATFDKAEYRVEFFTVTESWRTSVPAGGTVAAPETAPVREGFTFTGWYTDYTCQTLYTFGTPVNADMVLYAGWKKTTSAHAITLANSGQYVKVLINGKEASTAAANPGDEIRFVVTPPKGQYLHTIICESVNASNYFLGQRDDSGVVTSDVYTMPNADVTVSLIFADAGSLRIEVPDGVSGVSVFCSDPWLSRYYGIDEIGTDGVITLDRLPSTEKHDYYTSGLYEVRVYTDASRGWYTYEERGIEVRKEETTTVRAQLPTLYSVSGTVLADGESLPTDFFLYAMDNQGRYFSANVDSSGAYTFPGLPNGTYTLSASGKNGAYPVNQSFEVNSETVTLPDLSITRRGDLRVHLTVDNRKEAMRAQLALWERNDNNWLYVSGLTASAQGGTVLFEDVAENGKTYKVTVESLRRGNNTEVPFTSATNDSAFTVDFSGGKVFGCTAACSESVRTTQLLGSVSLSKQEVYPGDTVELAIRYAGAGTAGASFSLVLPQGVERVADGDIRGSGASGTLYVPLKITDSVSGMPRVTVQYDGQEFGSATLTAGALTLNAPASVKAGESFTLSGEAAPGSTITVKNADTGETIGTTQVKGRFFSLSASLNTSANLVAECAVNGAVLRSPAAYVLATEKPISVMSVQYGGNGAETVTGVGKEAAAWNSRLGAYSFYQYVDNDLLGFDLPLAVAFENESDRIKDVSYTFCDAVYTAVRRGDGYWYAQFPAGAWGGSGLKTITATVSTETETFNMMIAVVNLLIDPSGVVYADEARTVPLEGVTVTCLTLENGAWVTWDAESSGQVNPQVTGADGRYGWNVPEGTYRVIASKTGYESYDSLNDPNFTLDGMSSITIPPARTDIDFRMTGDPAEQYAIYPSMLIDGVEVEVGSVATAGTAVTLGIKADAATQVTSLRVLNTETRRELPLTKTAAGYTFLMPAADVTYELTAVNSAVSMSIESSSPSEVTVNLTGLTRSALLVGAYYDSANGRMLASASTEVKTAGSAELSFTGVGDATATLKLFLLDAETRVPLSPAVTK